MSFSTNTVSTVMKGLHDMYVTFFDPIEPTLYSFDSGNA